MDVCINAITLCAPLQPSSAAAAWWLWCFFFLLSLRELHYSYLLWNILCGKLVCSHASYLNDSSELFLCIAYIILYGKKSPWRWPTKANCILLYCTNRECICFAYTPRFLIISTRLINSTYDCRYSNVPRPNDTEQRMNKCQHYYRIRPRSRYLAFIDFFFARIYEMFWCSLATIYLILTECGRSPTKLQAEKYIANFQTYTIYTPYDKLFALMWKKCTHTYYISDIINEHTLHIWADSWMASWLLH